MILATASGRPSSQGTPWKFAALMDEHWMYKRRRSDGISNAQIDEWYSTRHNDGCSVASQSVRGQVAFSSSTPRILAGFDLAMAQAGLPEVRFGFDHDGSVVLARRELNVKYEGAEGGPLGSSSVDEGADRDCREDDERDLSQHSVAHRSDGRQHGDQHQKWDCQERIDGDPSATCQHDASGSEWKQDPVGDECEPDHPDVRSTLRLEMHLLRGRKTPKVRPTRAAMATGTRDLFSLMNSNAWSTA